MKRLALMAVFCAIAGYLLGDVMRATGAESRDAKEILDSKSQTEEARPKPRRVGTGTVELSPRDEDEQQLTQDENLPEDIRKAREQGAKARDRQLKEILYNLRHGIGIAKDRGWAMGGPYFPIGPDFLHVRPREKPVQMAAGTFVIPSPYAVAGPLQYGFLIGPGDATIVPHDQLVETFPVTPAIPEPETWSLLILGFGALALRMKRMRRAV